MLDRPVDGDSAPIDQLSHFEAAVPAVSSGGDEAKLCRLTEDHRQVYEKLQASEALNVP